VGARVARTIRLFFFESFGWWLLPALVPSTAGVVQNPMSRRPSSRRRTASNIYRRSFRRGGSGELNAKYPGGIKNLRARLAAEGHRVVKKGSRYFVADFERAVIEPKLA